MRCRSRQLQPYLAALTKLQCSSVGTALHVCTQQTTAVLSPCKASHGQVQQLATQVTEHEDCASMTRTIKLHGTSINRRE